jgi:phage terminase small subunit
MRAKMPPGVHRSARFNRSSIPNRLHEGMCSLHPNSSCHGALTLQSGRFKRTNAPMGERGPAPKPTALKKLHGTYRPDRAPEKEATPHLASGEELKAPDWLSEGAKAKMGGAGFTPALSRSAHGNRPGRVRSLLHLLEQPRDAEEAVREHGAITKAQSGYEAVSPHVIRAKNHLSELIKLSNLLGLNPSARTRITVSPETPGRAGFAPAGRQTKFHGVIAALRSPSTSRAWSHYAAYPPRQPVVRCRRERPRARPLDPSNARYTS